MKELYNVYEISMYLNCSESTVRKLIRNREIPFIKVSGKILFLKARIDKWLDDNKYEPLIVPKMECEIDLLG